MTKTRSPKNSLALPLIITVYLFVLFAWTYYRFTTHYSEAVDELFAKPLIWIVPVIFILLWKKVDLRTVSFKKITVKVFILSMLIGLGLSLLQIIPNVLKGYEQMHVPADLGILLISTIGTAVAEELLFRGFLLQQLQNYFSTTIANVISAVLFMCIHIPLLVIVNHISGASLFMGLYITLISGLVFGFLYLQTKSLWPPIIAHYVLDVILLIF